MFHFQNVPEIISSRCGMFVFEASCNKIFQTNKPNKFKSLIPSYLYYLLILARCSLNHKTIQRHTTSNIHHIQRHTNSNVHHIQLYTNSNIHHIQLYTNSNIHHIQLHTNSNIHHIQLHTTSNIHHIQLYTNSNIHHIQLYTNSNIHHIQLHILRNFRKVFLKCKMLFVPWINDPLFIFFISILFQLNFISI